MIPFFDAKPMHGPLQSAFESTFARVLEHSHFVLGHEVSQFEQAFADYCGTAHCVGVGNGLDALVLALRAWGIGPGDEVIVPAQTFVATWLAVSAVGALPVAVDVDPTSVLIDIEKVPAAVTPKTRAVIPVHLFGQAVDIEKLRSVLPSHVKILEDAAQAHGARSQGKRVGALGDAAAFSFYPTKNLGCLGDGGAVTSADPDFAKQVARLRNYGSERKYVHEVMGVNSRLDELQAALLSLKLPHLDAWNAQRVAVAQRYTERLALVPDLELPSVKSSGGHVFHLYVVKTERRDALQQALASQGITALSHYPVAPGDQPIYRPGVVAPHASRAAATCLSLPMWPGISDESVDKVCDSIRDFMKA